MNSQQLSQLPATMIEDISAKEKVSTNFRTSFYNPFEVKHRKRTSRAQFKVLEKTFLENPKPNAAVRRWLAQKLSMTPRGVQVWFQNRRAKEKTNKQQQQSSSTNDNMASPMMSSPVQSVCACADCCPMMSRTVSYEAATPITPTESQAFFPQFMYDLFPVYTNKQKPSNNWTFFSNEMNSPSRNNVIYYQPAPTESTSEVNYFFFFCVYDLFEN